MPSPPTRRSSTESAVSGAAMPNGSNGAPSSLRVTDSRSVRSSTSTVTSPPSRPANPCEMVLFSSSSRTTLMLRRIEAGNACASANSANAALDPGDVAEIGADRHPEAWPHLVLRRAPG